MKRYKDWKGNLADFVNVGDEVEEKIVEHFIFDLPPKTNRAWLVQAGEPHTVINGKITYVTFYKENGSWYYGGLCYEGEHIQPIQNDED